MQEELHDAMRAPASTELKLHHQQAKYVTMCVRQSCTHRVAGRTTERGCVELADRGQGNDFDYYGTKYEIFWLRRTGDNEAGLLCVSAAPSGGERAP